jgi:hypothetical protein
MMKKLIIASAIGAVIGAGIWLYRKYTLDREGLDQLWGDRGPEMGVDFNAMVAQAAAGNSPDEPDDAKAGGW